MKKEGSWSCSQSRVPMRMELQRRGVLLQQRMYLDVSLRFHSQNSKTTLESLKQAGRNKEVAQMWRV